MTERSFAFSVLFVVAFGAACTPGQRAAARTALDITQTLCLVAHQALPDVDALKVCGVAEPFFDPARQLLASSRAASAQAVAGARLAGTTCK